MAYDRYDTRDAQRHQGRDQDARWSEDDRYSNRDRGRGSNRGDRGFFERAGDEVASWFGDEDAERRHREDEMRDGRSHREHSGRQSDNNRNEARGYGRDY